MCKSYLIYHTAIYMPTEIKETAQSQINALDKVFLSSHCKQRMEERYISENNLDITNIKHSQIIHITVTPDTNKVKEVLVRYYLNKNVFLNVSIDLKGHGIGKGVITTCYKSKVGKRFNVQELIKTNKYVVK